MATGAARRRVLVAAVDQCRRRRRDGSDTSDLPECPLGAPTRRRAREIQLWYGGLVMPTSGVLVDLIKKFNASQDKVKVVGNDQGVDYNETMRAFDRVVATPERLPNIVYLEDIQLGKMVDSNTVLPAQSCMEADDYDMREILPAVRAGFSVDDVLYPVHERLDADPLLQQGPLRRPVSTDVAEDPRRDIEMAPNQGGRCGAHPIVQGRAVVLQHVVGRCGRRCRQQPERSVGASDRADLTSRRRSS